jgi:DNA-binding SARP family transcriptional activator/TolB-like protein/Tfp pilus assembly protein PilF
VLRIRALGGLTVERGDERVLGAAAQPRRLALLAMVARAGSRGISRDQLQATLWPDTDAERAAHALKQALYALRRDAGTADLFLGTRDLRLNPEEIQSDVGEFVALVQRGEHRRAVALHAGPFVHGFRLPAVPEFEYWVEEERREIEQTLVRALDALAREAREQADAAAAVAWCRRLAALEPLNARRTNELMRALLATGDRAGALQQARIYDELVSQELDLAPDAAVEALVQRIRDGSEPAAPAAAPSPTQTPRSTPATTPLVSSNLTPNVTPNVGVTTVAPDDVPPLSVAVLPFIGTETDGLERSLCEGLSEELISTLGRVADLRVPVRSAVAAVRAGVSDLALLGTRLRVRMLLEGSVRRVGDTLRVTARLVDAQTGTPSWSERYDRRATNVLALEDELAATIAAAAERALRASTGPMRVVSARERADACYAEGMRVWSPQGAGLGQGLEQFRQAIAIDPSHARAHAALAESYTQLAFYGFLPAQRAAELADAGAREAMRLDPELAESHLARGTCLLWVHHDFAEGTRALERALEIDPASIVAKARLAFVRLCHDGPLESERAEAQRAAATAGANGLARIMYGQQLLAGHRFDDAIDALHDAIDAEEPHFLAYHWLVVAYIQKGLGAEAVAAAVAEASLSDRHPWSLLSLVTATAMAGQRRRAETLLDTLRARATTGYVQASVLGLAHAALGDLETAMRHLERAVEEHDPSMMMLKTFPMFREFRAHPRYRALLHSAGWRDWDTAEFAVAPGAGKR